MKEKKQKEKRVHLRLSQETAQKVGRKYLNFEMYAQQLGVDNDTPDKVILAAIEKDLVLPVGTLEHYRVLKDFPRMVVHPVD